MTPGVGPLRYIRLLGGIMQIGFMAAIAGSGNLAFLNWLTMIPGIACLDDAFFEWIIPFYTAPEAPAAASDEDWRMWSTNLVVRVAMEVTLVYIILTCSWPVIENLLQLNRRRQVMNASFGPWKIINTYGAFGSVGKVRCEAIVSASHDGETWHEFHFNAKPGRLDRRPVLI